MTLSSTQIYQAKVSQNEIKFLKTFELKFSTADSTTVVEALLKSCATPFLYPTRKDMQMDALLVSNNLSAAFMEEIECVEKRQLGGIISIGTGLSLKKLQLPQTYVGYVSMKKLLKFFIDIRNTTSVAFENLITNIEKSFYCRMQYELEGEKKVDEYDLELMVDTILKLRIELHKDSENIETIKNILMTK